MSTPRSLPNDSSDALALLVLADPKLPLIINRHKKVVAATLRCLKECVDCLGVSVVTIGRSVEPGQAVSQVRFSFEYTTSDQVTDRSLDVSPDRANNTTPWFTRTNWTCAQTGS